MRQTAVLPPVAAADRHEVHLGHDERAADGRSDLRGAFLAETNMSVEIADRNVGLEARALARGGLLLHGLDGHDLVLELASGRGEEVVDDLVLLDRHRVEEDLLEAADAALLHEAAELGDRNPFILVVAAAPVIDR